MMENQTQEKQCSNSPSTKETVLQEFEQTDQNFEYFRLFQKLFSESVKLKHEMEFNETRQKRTSKRINYLCTKADNFRDYVCPEENPKKKFERRGADQILKQFICPADRCNRSYGSQTAFRKHQKLKHPQVYSPKKRGRAENKGEQVQMICLL